MYTCYTYIDICTHIRIAIESDDAFLSHYSRLLRLHDKYKQR